MFFRIIVFCLFFCFNIHLCYAQYARPGWFVVEDAANLSEDKVERNSFVADEKTNLTQVNEQPSFRHSQKHDLRKKSEKYAKLLDNGFSLGKRELKLATLLLKDEYEENTRRNFVISPLSFYAVSVLLANFTGRIVSSNPYKKIRYQEKIIG